MATDSSMRNIAEVEQYAKNLENVSNQVKQVFDRVKHQTDQIGQNWNDTQFNTFREHFEQNIQKQVEGICMTLQRLALYAKKQCEFHYMTRQQRF